MTMTSLPDPATLKSFGHAAAGHDGVLTDEDNTIVVKPCTPAEVTFYQFTNAEHPQLAYFMPRFLGTLCMNTSASEAGSSDNSSGSASTKALQQGPADVPSTTSSRVDFSEPLRVKGKAIDTDTCIVLSAITAGFKQPNVLDLKLGSRLWADDALPSKRARLDKVSGETTSGSLGFRIAGMRVWTGLPAAGSASGETTPEASIEGATADTVAYDKETNYLIYNKLYGRSLDVDSVTQGFRAYFDCKPGGLSHSQVLRLIRCFRREILELIEVLRNLDSRMYSSSILLVFEGELEAHQAALAIEDSKGQENTERKASTEPPSPQSVPVELAGAQDQLEIMDNESINEETPKRSYALKMIDFAHATWEQGKGPDGNVLHGLCSIATILKDLESPM